MSYFSSRIASVVLTACLISCSDTDSSGPSGAPAELLIVSGDAQQSTVGTVLPESLVVSVRDSRGRPVAGIPVLFSLAANRGSPSEETVHSGSDGEAGVLVTLGEVAGPLHVNASIPDITSLDFAALALAGAPAQVTITSGNDQSAAPGAAVAINPQVLVRDEFGNPSPGVAVTFTPSAGGSVTGGIGQTDTNGLISVGSWMLGPARGENELAVVVGWSELGSVTAFAATTSPDIVVLVLTPTSNQLTGDELPLRVRVHSTFSVGSVTASYGGMLVPLTLVPTTSNEYQGTISLVGAPRDTLALFVSATDVNGGVEDAVRLFIHDREPTLIIAAPFGSSVARPSIAIAATCADDDPAGCTSLTVRHDGVLVAQGNTAINGSFNLQGSGSTWLTFEAIDSRGQQRLATRRVFVEPAASLQDVASAEGVLLDYHADGRLLFVDSTSTPRRVVLRPTVGADQFIPLTAQWLQGFVTPDGAMLVGWSTNYRVEHLRNGALGTTTLSSPDVTISGDWALLLPTPPGPIRRDLLTGTDLPLPSFNQGDVATNGDVAYSAQADLDLFWYRGGTSTRITTDDEALFWNRAPRTDGTGVVYREESRCCNPVTYRILLHDGINEIELAPSRTREPVRDLDYAVSGGWVAFTRPDGTNRLQVWTRSPAGALRQVSFLGSDARIDALAPNGSVVFSGGLQRYHATATAAATSVMSTNGSVRWVETRFIVLLGRMALAIN